jgi:hypothetical protein
MSTEASQVPLTELLRAVPADARILVDDKDGKGTRNHPVGALCLQAAKVIESEDDALTQCIQERDSYHEWADKLAAAISAHFGVDIGEHSSANNPWREALEASPVATAPAGGAEPACPNCGGTGVDGDVGDRGEIVETPCACRSTAPTAQPQPQPQPEPNAEDAAVRICNAVAELGDRNSPEDWPEAMLVTHAELHAIVVEALAAQPEAPAEPSLYVLLRDISNEYARSVGAEVDDWLNRSAAKLEAFYATPAPVAQQPAELTDEQITAAWKAWPELSITSASKAISFLRFVEKFKAQGDGQ